MKTNGKFQQITGTATTLFALDEYGVVWEWKHAANVGWHWGPVGDRRMVPQDQVEVAQVVPSPHARVGVIDVGGVKPTQG